MLFNWKLKILSSVVAVAMLFTVCPSTTFATKTWLHELLEDEKHAPSIEEVERIVKKHPEWLNEEANDGRTPVKIAGDKGLSEIATFLSGFVPPSSGPDYYAKRMAAIIDNTTTWLHEVLEDKDVSLEEIKHIVDKHEEWLSEKDAEDRTPYDIAKEKELREDILLILTEPPMLSPSALSKKMTALKTQMEELQKCSKILQEKVDRLQKQMADLTTQAVAITGGTIDSAAITGGTVSGLTTPLAVADGGTGLNALGTPTQGLLTVRGNTSSWSALDCLNIAHAPQIQNASLNSYNTAGSFEVTGTNVTDRPASATPNATANLIVRRIYAQVYQKYIDIYGGGKEFTRVSTDSGSTWSDWQYSGENIMFHATHSGSNQTLSLNTYNVVQLNGLVSDSAHAFNTTTYTYTIPKAGFWFFYGHVEVYVKTISQVSCGVNVAGSVYLSSITPTPGGLGNNNAQVCGIVNCSKGVTVQLVTYGYGNGNYIDSAAYANFLGGIFLSK